MAFFAMLNPLANTPVFLGITQDQDDTTRKQTARLATFVAFWVVFVFTILGKYIFELFDLTIPAFKITGGILVFYIGFKMLMSEQAATKKTGAAVTENDNVAISPLAVPILAGPGMIVTAMNYATNASLIHIAVIVGMLAMIIFLNYVAFSLAKEIVQICGQNLIAVVGKLMGLILAIIGAGMTIDGIKMAFAL